MCCKIFQLKKGNICVRLDLFELVLYIYSFRSEMASIPLMSDQDLEEGRGLPDYNEATKATKKYAPKGNRLFRYAEETANMGMVAQASVAIRLGFLRKVFGILSFQLIATIILSSALYFTPGVRGFVQQQPWILFVNLFGSIAVLFAMFVHARSVPLNYILLTVWTVMQALVIGSIVLFYDVDVVIQAAILTAVAVVGLFIFTLQSKRDFQKHYALLFTCSAILMMGMFLQVVFMSPTFDLLMAIFGAIVFAAYLVIDIDFIMNHSSPEDYIIACINLYLDIVNLFLEILRILNELNRNN
uniref:Protein lifeguard 4 n=2 Tax=Steinernema glaseri TaxID=37863 RepID=A0A1I7XWF0_9BILA